MKKFNIAGVCVPEKHYMVDLTSRLDIIGRKCLLHFHDWGRYNSLKAFIFGIANDCLVDVYDVGDY